MKLFCKKTQNFRALGAPPQCLRRLGALPPNPQRLGVSPPDPHWPPAAGGSAPRPPKQPPPDPQNSPPHCEFLATRLHTRRRLHTFPLIAERKAEKLWIPIFIVFGSNRPRIEPESTASVADALSIWPLIGYNRLQHFASNACIFRIAKKKKHCKNHAVVPSFMSLVVHSRPTILEKFLSQTILSNN